MTIKLALSTKDIPTRLARCWQTTKATQPKSTSPAVLKQIRNIVATFIMTIFARTRIMCEKRIFSSKTRNLQFIMHNFLDSFDIQSTRKVRLQSAHRLLSILITKGMRRTLLVIFLLNASLFIFEFLRKSPILVLIPFEDQAT